MTAGTRLMLGAAIVAATGLGAPLSARTVTPGEERAAAIFDEVAGNEARLRVFLQAMPKGGDLHNHLSGAVYAEDFLARAAALGLCFDEASQAIAEPPCAPGTEIAGTASADPFRYAEMVDALSTRAWRQGVGANDATGHRRFFGSFDRFGVVASEMRGESLALARRYAAADHVLYLELFHSEPAVIETALAAPGGDLAPEDFAGAFAEIRPTLPALMEQASKELDADEATARQELGCDTDMADAGCEVAVRYNGFALRGFSPLTVFRTLAHGFAFAAHDPRVLGMSIVAPEDDPVALADYDLHMRMFRFLSEQFPTVKINPHAGELAPGLVPPTELRDHIAKAIAIAGAQRIGHGVDIAQEDNAAETLARMARDGIAVEINLTSNDVILGVSGARHPIELYRAAGVPIVLSTDDEGVLRSDLTGEYLRAATEHGLGYRALKDIARASLEYSFLPGDSLWGDGGIGGETVCSPFSTADAEPMQACRNLIAGSEKASEQWRLERAFADFESKVATWTF